jgi:hypothetical protein
MFILNINKMAKTNRNRRARRRGTNRRGGAGAAPSASRRSRGPSDCEWRVTSSMVDREDMDIEDFGDNHPHPTVHFNDIVGKNGQIRNGQLRDTLRRTCNQKTMAVPVVQRGIPRVTHVRRSHQLLIFYHDGECVGHVTVAPTGRVPEWMIRRSPNPRRSPNGTKYPKWMTTSQSFNRADVEDPDDNNPLPTVDLEEIVDRNGEIVQTSLKHMLSHTCNRPYTGNVPVEGITNVTHVRRSTGVLSFYNNDTYLGNIIVQAMGDKQPSWMR